MKLRTAVWVLLNVIIPCVIGFVHWRVPLDARLTVFILAGIVAITLVAAHLKRWCLVTETTALGAPTTGAKRVRVAFATTPLLLMCLVVATMLRLATTYHSVTYGPMGVGESTRILVRAARPVASKVAVQYPPVTITKCTPVDPDSTHRAKVYLIAPDGPAPQAIISDFQHPQSFGLVCVAPVNASQLRVLVEPPTIGALHNLEVRRLSCQFYLGGSVIWLLAALAFAFYCHPYLPLGTRDRAQ